MCMHCANRWTDGNPENSTSSPNNEGSNYVKAVLKLRYDGI